MSALGFEVRVAAGSRSGEVVPTYVVPHTWTDGGIAVEGGGTGAHLLLTAIGCCVLNDVFREAGPRGIAVVGVRVDVTGEFDDATWASTSVGYQVAVDSGAGADELDGLLARVADVAEIPRAVGGEVAVTRR
jgi:uncharacterized OsmC-like protein